MFFVSSTVDLRNEDLHHTPPGKPAMGSKEIINRFIEKPATRSKLSTPGSEL